MFKQKLPAIKNGYRLVIKNIAIALKTYPIKRLSQHLSIGFWTDRPLVRQEIIYGKEKATMVTCYANVWIGIRGIERYQTYIQGLYI